ncbi:hypothetical protein Q4491_04430 [Photobacterium sp. 2_MG-2023]|uniref:hypothetical protein n=1 Tax=Photobacterium TaxID=657 RepID=UPI0026E25DEC|nr:MULTISPECIES: hypothetical protein [Photobacterium]MDO6580584.1 hypothetical protein [Photobacterium sp. 2_MG-2023]
MSISKRSNSVAGFMFIASLLVLSILPAYLFVGDYIEKGITFLSGIVTIGVVVALASIWRDVDLFKPVELKTLSIALPLLTVVQFIYLMFAYPEQDIFSELVSDYVLEFTVYLFVSTVIWRSSKS